MPKGKPRAIVFDSDGTLLDSFELIYAAQIASAKAHGQTPPTREAYRAQLGKSLLQIFEALYPGADHQGMIAVNGDYFAAHATEAQMFEGLHELLGRLKASGLKLALLTGGNHKVHNVLHYHGLGQYFDSVVHFERTTHPKPHPEGFFLAAKECGVAPDEAVMVGDTVIDMQTGKAAGAYTTIGITHGLGSAEELTAAGAEHLAGSLPELFQLITSLRKATESV